MTKAQKKEAPDSFSQRNQVQYQRVVHLTQRAIAQLQAKHKSVTLTAIAETTQVLDDQRKGILPKTILRNPEASALFRQHSPAYQMRQQKVRKAKRKRAKVGADTRAAYRGLHFADLVEMVEGLKQQNAELKEQLEKRQVEREEAYRLRDEALRLNARQLAMLTKMTSLPDPARGANPAS